MSQFYRELYFVAQIFHSRVRLSPTHFLQSIHSIFENLTQKTKSQSILYEEKKLYPFFTIVELARLLLQVPASIDETERSLPLLRILLI